MIIKTAKKKIERELGVVEKIEKYKKIKDFKTYKITIAGDLYLLKVSEQNDTRYYLENEAKAIQKYSDFEIAMPKFYLYFEEEATGFLITDYVEGETLTEALEHLNQEELIFDFGQLVKSLHEIICEGTADWLTIAEHEESVLESIKPSLIHGDCTTDHIWVAAGKVHSFINMGSMESGDARYDLALASRNFTEEQKEIFYKGYELRRLLESEKMYFEEGILTI